MGWHAEAQSGRGVLGELRGESARVRRLSRTGRAQLADSVGTPWQVGNGCRHAVKEVDVRPGCSRIDNRTEHTTICKGSDRFYGGATRGHHAHLLRSVMAVERVQELSSRHSGWYQLAVHRADHCRLLRRYRGQVRFRQPQLGADRLLHQRGVHCRPTGSSTSAIAAWTRSAQPRWSWRKSLSSWWPRLSLSSTPRRKASLVSLKRRSLSCLSRCRRFSAR